MKTMFFSIVAVLTLAFLSMPVLAAPEISDLEINTPRGIAKGESRPLVVTFKSDVEPDDVVLEYSGLGQTYRGTTPGFRRQHEWKKDQLRVVIDKKEAGYQVKASCGYTPPQTDTMAVRAEVWIKAGGQQSNKLSGTIK